ncbi:MAG: beta-lactamase [Sphingomonadales bacterium]|nr:beta-lactamase [Sphingomonadales bacterium]
MRIPGIVVGITDAGKRQCFAYGVASIESQHPVDAFTRFEIGSVSKVFTCLLTALAAAKGRLRWSDPVSLHLPRLKGSPLGNVTLEQLATYTAGGLPLQFPDAVPSWDAAWEYFEGWGPTSAPGSPRLYSNLSIGLLGAATAAASGDDFSVLMEQQVFAPLGLSHSFMQWPNEEMPNFAWGYDANNKPIRARIVPGSAEAYGVKTSADDLLAVLEALIDPMRISGRALQVALRDTMQPRFLTPAFAQCLGWERYDFPAALPQLLKGNGPDMILKPQPVTAVPDSFPPGELRMSFFNKTGSTNGFGAYVAIMPERSLGLVMLSNRNVPNSERVKAAKAILMRSAAARAIAYAHRVETATSKVTRE